MHPYKVMLDCEFFADFHWYHKLDFLGNEVKGGTHSHFDGAPLPEEYKDMLAKCCKKAERADVQLSDFFNKLYRKPGGRFFLNPPEV